MKIYTVIYTVLSLVAALILAGFVTAIGFIPPLVPYEFTIKFTVTITAGVVSVIILVGGVGGVLGGEGNTRWLSAGAGAISLILTAASVVGGWYIFWVNPIARAEYEDVVLGDSSFAKELVSGLLDEAYDEDCSEAGYFDYRIGLWYGASYSSYGYRRGAPINLYVSHCPGLVWTVSASGYFPVPVASVKNVNINPYQMRVGPDGLLEVEDDAGEWVPLSTVSGYLANDPKASDSLRRLLKEDVGFSIDCGAPGVMYYIYSDRFDVQAERERLSRLLDLIAGFYPARYDYNWDPAEFGDYNV